MLMLGGMVMMPATMVADDGGYDDTNQEIHRSPVHNPYVYINCDESNGTALVSFNSAVDNAEILVYQNGVEVDYQTFDATVGTLFPIYLLDYGSGEFIIQVKRGTMLLATCTIPQ